MGRFLLITLDLTPFVGAALLTGTFFYLRARARRALRRPRRGGDNLTQE